MAFLLAYFRSHRADFSFQHPSRNRVPLNPTRFLLLSLLVPAFVFASLRDIAAPTGRIAGVVTDSSGHPVANARVTLIESGATLCSDEEGRYSLGHIVAGRHSLLVERMGFRSAERSDIELEPGRELTIDFRLLPQPIPAEPVWVKGRRDNNLYQFHDRVALRRKDWNIGGASEIGDALRMIPGVTVLQGDGSSRISLRGSPVRAVRVDLDGMPLNDAGTGEAELGWVDLDQIRAMEVEFQGWGGEVHLISKGGRDLDSLRNLTVGADLAGSGESRVSGRGAFSGGSVSGDVQGCRRNNPGDFGFRLDNGQQAKRINNHRETVGYSGRLSVQSEAIIWSGAEYYVKDRRGIPGLLYAPPTPEASLTSKRLMSQLSGTGERDWGRFAAQAFRIGSVNRFVSPAEQWNPETGIMMPQVPEDDRQRSERWGLNARIDLRKRAFEANLRLGTLSDSYLGEDLLRGRKTVAGVGFGRARRITSEVETGGQWFGRAGEARMVVGSSLNLIHLAEPGCSAVGYVLPRVRATLGREIPIGSVSLSAGWGRNLTPPPFNASFAVESVYFVGNAKLRPESGEAFDLGLHLVSCDGGQSLSWQMGITMIQSRTRNLIVWRRNFQGKYYPENLVRSRGRGIETAGRLALWGDGISISGSYIYSRVSNDTPGDINRGRRVPLIPDHQGSVGLRLQSRGCSLALTGRWEGRRYSTESNQDPKSTAGMGLNPYIVWDCSVKRAWPVGRMQIEVHLGMDNIFDRSYRMLERTPMPGRAFKGGVKLGV